jgi:hypothetical protein
MSTGTGRPHRRSGGAPDVADWGMRLDDAASADEAAAGVPLGCLVVAALHRVARLGLLANPRGARMVASLLPLLGVSLHLGLVPPSPLLGARGEFMLEPGDLAVE